MSSFFSSLLDLFHEAIDFSSPSNVLKTLHLIQSPIEDLQATNKSHFLCEGIFFNSQVDSNYSIPWNINNVLTLSKFWTALQPQITIKWTLTRNIHSSYCSFKKVSVVIDFDNGKQWTLNKIAVWIKFQSSSLRIERVGCFLLGNNNCSKVFSPPLYWTDLFGSWEKDKDKPIFIWRKNYFFFLYYTVKYLNSDT